MAYRIAARFYANEDQIGESYILISDNSKKDTKLEIGEKVILTVDGKCSNCGELFSHHNKSCPEPDKEVTDEG